MRILLTGGGTGGHIYPLLAVAEKLKKIESQKRIDIGLYYLGAPENYAYLLEKCGIKVLKIISAKRRKYFDPRNFIDLPKFFISTIQAFWKVLWLMPDILFSKGGPGSFPVVLACSFYKIPIIIHESDSIAGLANLKASKHASRIGISFIDAKDSFLEFYKKDQEKAKIAEKIALVGNPVRELLTIQKESDFSKETAKKAFGFDSQKPLIFVLCGSQGAVRINGFFLTIAEDLLVSGFQVLHQTGIKNFNSFNNELNVVLNKLPENLRQNYKTAPYFEDNIKDAYIAADLIVSRAGSGSIAEISIMGKPSILLPIPEEIAGHHQLRNAYEYSKTGAAIMLEEENVKSHLFIDQLKKLLNNPDKLKLMAEAAKKFSKPQAAETIAEEILSIAKK